MKPHHGPRRIFGETNGLGAAREAAPAGGGGGSRAPAAALTSDGLGKFEAPKPAGFHAPVLLAHGIDSLYVAYYVDTVKPTFDWDDIAYEKERARQARRGRFKEMFFGSETLALLPVGSHPYTYVLKNQDFVIRLGERINPACHVQFISQGLWAHGYKAQHARIVTWLESVGLRRTRAEAVSRVDWAFDYQLPHIDFDESNIVSRAAIEAIWLQNKAVRTFQIGTGDTVVRIYDKVAEINQASDKRWFFDLWGVSEGVWRVEAQARRERLKQAGIRSLQDLSDMGGDLLREITGKHTTLRRITTDKNRSRWPLHPLWQSVQSDIALFDQVGLVREINAKAGYEWRRRRLYQSVYGYMKRLAAFESLQGDGKQLPDLGWAVEALQDGLQGIHDSADWRSDVERIIAEERLGL
jgi:hypothetical protein